MARVGLLLTAIICIIFASSAFADSLFSRLNLKRLNSFSMGGGNGQQQSATKKNQSRLAESNGSSKQANWPETETSQTTTTTASNPIEAGQSRTGKQQTTTADLLLFVGGHTTSDRYRGLKESPPLPTSEPVPAAHEQTNGTAILEDLVNQFLEKNREAVWQASADQLNSSRTYDQFYDKSGISDDGHDATVQLVVGPHVTEPISSPSTMPFMQLVALTAGSPTPNALLEGGGNEDTYNNGNYQELDDSHIQYDRPQMEPVGSYSPAAVVAASSSVELERRVDIRENDSLFKSSGQLIPDKLISTKLVGKPNAVSNHNYTLSVIRVAPDEGRSEIKSENSGNNNTTEKPSKKNLNEAPPIHGSTSGKVGEHPDFSPATTATAALPPSTSSQVNLTLIAAQNNSTDAQQVANMLASAASSQRSVQARSMNSGGSQSGKALQHSRPPYATNDQFHHRAGPIQANPLLGADSLLLAPISNPSTSNGQQSGDLESSSNSNSLLGKRHNEDSSIGSKTNDSQQQQQEMAPTIVSAVAQISSHLNGDAARGSVGAAGTTSTTTLSSDPVRKQKPTEQAVLSDDRLQLQKLAPASQLVELNPIPAAQQPQQETFSPERFYFSKENQPFNLFPSHSLSHREQNDGQSSSDGLMLGLADESNKFADYNGALFFGDSVSLPSSSSLTNTRHPDQMGAERSKNSSQPVSRPTRVAVPPKITTATHESRNGTADLRHQDRDGHHYIAPTAMVQRKTLESVSNQLQNSAPDPFIIDNDYQRQQQLQGDLNHQMKRTSSLANGGSFAASLVNVTAPMVPPLSATEAMESALGGHEAAKNLLRQVSGFLRSTPAPSAVEMPAAAAQTSSSSASTGEQRAPIHRQNQYFLPSTNALLEAQQQLLLQQPIYSQPANQFSPRPFLEPTNSVTSASSLESATNSSNAADKERMRLDGANSFLVGLRTKPSPHAASISNDGSNGSNAHQASGFRPPPAHGQSAVSSSLAAWISQQSAPLPIPSSYLNGNLASQAPPISTQQMSPASYQAYSADLSSSTTSSYSSLPASTSQSPPSSSPSPSYGTSTTSIHHQGNNSSSGSSGGHSMTTAAIAHTTREPMMVISTGTSTPTTNGFITAGYINSSQSADHHLNGGSLAPSPVTQQQTFATTSPASSSASSSAAATAAAASMSQGLTRRVFNLTRVEHISAECSNDLIKTVIVFNGTFKGIIYSSGYVRDPNCMYINGTGKTRYEFSIRLNQCGTLGRQELHPSSGPNEIRRRDQVMWNTLSIQYNPIIEQEWDEHFRVSCEYGSDFWKTVSFSPFNVETNTGSPVVFTVDPPQCQMEILRGHGMVGPRQEAVSGPVTVGDPLTLLIHMKSEKAGYDILVKNCIAHNGGHQKMQLIDSNGCVVNERFISPFRGTYNDNDLKHVTLYSYLKAFRFTGSPVLYLECEIHMCQSSCPPQMCYWRRLSKRSTRSTTNTSTISSSGSKLTMLDGNDSVGNSNYHYANDDDDDDGEKASAAAAASFVTKATGIFYDSSLEPPTTIVPSAQRGRQARRLDVNSDASSGSNREAVRDKALQKSQDLKIHVTKPAAPGQGEPGQISDKVSLFQALEVRQERGPDVAPYSIEGRQFNTVDAYNDNNDDGHSMTTSNETNKTNSLMCYRRVEVFAFLITGASVLFVALSVIIGCCWQAASLRRLEKKRLTAAARVSSANLSHCGSPMLYHSSSSSSISNGSANSSNCGSSASSADLHNVGLCNKNQRPYKSPAATTILSTAHHHISARHKERLLHSNY